MKIQLSEEALNRLWSTYPVIKDTVDYKEKNWPDFVKKANGLDFISLLNERPKEVSHEKWVSWVKLVQAERKQAEVADIPLTAGGVSAWDPFNSPKPSPSFSEKSSTCPIVRHRDTLCHIYNECVQLNNLLIRMGERLHFYTDENISLLLQEDEPSSTLGEFLYNIQKAQGTLKSNINTIAEKMFGSDIID